MTIMMIQRSWAQPTSCKLQAEVGLCMATLVALGCVSFIVGGWVRGPVSTVGFSS